jgi:hypothetical protein
MMDFRAFRLHIPDFRFKLSGNVSLQVVLRLILNRLDACLKSKKALSFTLAPWNNLRYNVSPLVVLRLMR